MGTKPSRRAVGTHTAQGTQASCHVGGRLVSSAQEEEHVREGKA